jgi:hypothetical protein
MGGQRIDDHNSIWGKNRANAPFPDGGGKMKQISDQEGAGSVMRYEDTEMAIDHVQNESVKHLKGRPLKPGYRY